MNSQRLIALLLWPAVWGCATPQEPAISDDSSFTVIAIGDAGESGGTLRANASYITDMFTGRHDAGPVDALFFLGDNFYNVGLNVPLSEVDGMIRSVLYPFRTVMDGLGRSRVHAITGNHDYYAWNALDISYFLGLIDIEQAPVGLSDRGNAREAAIEQWMYYYHMPSHVTFPIGASSEDSVTFIFVDSALPLRTPVASWTPPLDSLRVLLEASSRRRGILWRILVMHHPMYTVGEHGGYSVWDDERETVEYLTGCDKDSNAVGWMKNWLDPEDVCAEKYRMFMDSLKACIIAGGAPVQVSLTGHDHSLQLLSISEAHPLLPRIHIISGAGSKSSRVKLPDPPTVYTASDPKDEGRSQAGFVRLTFRKGGLHVRFFESKHGGAIDMGGGVREFVLKTDGTFLQPAQ